MNRKRLYLIAMMLVLAAAVAAGRLWQKLGQVPQFYEEAIVEQTDPEVRRKEADEFEAQTAKLVEEIKRSGDWSQVFTQRQINSWLAEGFEEEFADRIPAEVTHPRINFGNGLVQIGFRYTGQNWQGVVSLELKPRVLGPNRLALEVESVKAGEVSVPMSRVRQTVSTVLANEGWNVFWNKNDGNDVLLVDLNHEESDRPVLDAVTVEEGTLTLTGRNRMFDSGSLNVFQISRLAD